MTNHLLICGGLGCADRWSRFANAKDGAPTCSSVHRTLLRRRNHAATSWLCASEPRHAEGDASSRIPCGPPSKTRARRTI